MYTSYLEDNATKAGIKLKDGTFLDVHDQDDYFGFWYDGDDLSAFEIPNFCGGVLLSDVVFNEKLIEATLDYLWNEGYTLVSYISNNEHRTDRFKALGFVVTHSCVNRRTGNLCSYLTIDISERINTHLENDDPFGEDEEDF